MDSAYEINKDVILFDGVCNLCNGFVNFIIDRDKGKHFLFGSLQRQQGSDLMKSRGLDPMYFGSVVLVQRHRVLTKSRAALEVLKLLGFPWSLFYAGVILPGPIRDWVYDWIARNRYRWFGKRDSCRMPTPELRERFLDS